MTSMPQELDKGTKGGFPFLVLYLFVVLIAHLVTIAVATKEGSLVLVLFWLYGGLPFFVPGFLLAVAYLFRALFSADTSYRLVRILFSAPAIILPMYEWHLLYILPSGYQGG